MMRTTHIADEEVVVAIDVSSELETVATHHRHLSKGYEWHGDVFEIESSFVISHLTVDVKSPQSVATDAVAAFVQYAQKRCPRGKKEGIMATVDHRFFDVFEGIGFTRVMEFLCVSGETIASMHLLWPGELSEDDLQRMRQRSFGRAAVAYCTRCENSWGADHPAIVDKCPKCVHRLHLEF